MICLWKIVMTVCLLSVSLHSSPLIYHYLECCHGKVSMKQIETVQLSPNSHAEVGRKLLMVSPKPRVFLSPPPPAQKADEKKGEIGVVFPSSQGIIMGAPPYYSRVGIVRSKVIQIPHNQRLGFCPRSLATTT